MTPPDSSDAPTPGEFKRWLTRLEHGQSEMNRNMVSQQLWANELGHLNRRIDNLAGDVQSLRADLKAEMTSKLADMKVESQTRGAQKWQVYMAIFGAVLSLVVAVILLVWSR